MADAVTSFLDMPVSGMAGLQPPTGTHHGGDHHDDAAAVPAASASDSAGWLPAREA
jgi:hypothetical protein